MRLNSSGTLMVEILKYVVKFDLKLQNNKSMEYDQPFLKGTFDSCRVQRGVLGNIVVKIIVSQIEKYSNYKFECPQKTGFYYATNYPIVENFDNLPPFLVAFMGEPRTAKVSASVRAKFRGVQKAVLLVSSEALVTYEP